jgi:hypothetical protein
MSCHFLLLLSMWLPSVDLPSSQFSVFFNAFKEYYITIQFLVWFSEHRERVVIIRLNICFSVRVYNQMHHNIIVRMICALSIMVAFHLAADAVPTGDVRLFYGCQFMLHAIKPLLLFIGVPEVARLVKWKQQWRQMVLVTQNCGQKPW